MDVDAGALRMLVRRWMCKGGGADGAASGGCCGCDVLNLRHGMLCSECERQVDVHAGLLDVGRCVAELHAFRLFWPSNAWVVARLQGWF